MTTGPPPQARWVLHLDMDAFFASVEQLTRPTLRGRPVLVGGTGSRGVVAGASYEARPFGARSAMPMHMARRLIGVTAVVVPPRGVVYRAASKRVFGVVRDMIPVIEQLSLDEAFGEPAQLAGAPGAVVEEFCAELRARVLDVTGLDASVGAGSGKQVAKIASGLAKPRGQRIVSRNDQEALLAPLPVRKLWGIGPVAEQRLRSMGVETIGDLARLSASEANALLGSMGSALRALAQGIDDRPVKEGAAAKQVSAETTFPRDLMTKPEVRSAVQTVGESAHRRLASDGRGARTVTVKLRKADMSILTRSATLPFATMNRDALIGAAQKLAMDPVEIGPIRLVGVSFSGLSAAQQEVLFPEIGSTGNELDEVTEAPPAPAETPSAEGNEFLPGADVHHPEYGHGWVQGSGHGVVTVRFETRTSGPGPVKTFPMPAEDLTHADPLVSLDWPDV
ncbi:DNA polymerase-4 [Hoyosella altamirensis]|uniref:DNA polymerase IV n=2 Tax=Hoyosella altamirensis TaxID=616997 RepID=A0A839RKI2_9ACTN|nr:DNA polymerase IV [Hoyosella altamirensis]MBB3036626.1 DNA polymerase-4 [Hoyosella altamirensis]